jgi:hypothetical protein
MIDIGKQIQHWRSGADEDWDVAQELIGHDKIRHGLFLASLVEIPTRICYDYGT